jgi:hypothetical protein
MQATSADTLHRKKKVEEEAPDFFRLRDNEGNPVICHLCNKPTAENRAIVPCSVCGLWWHIDCLDPPLAQPPVLRTWRCPAHVDDLLVKIPGVRGPAHRFRKIKGAADITPTYSRGNVNNGWIEIIDDESEDESGYKDRNTFGRVQRLRATGIEKDFIYQYVMYSLTLDVSDANHAAESEKTARASLLHLSWRLL